MFKFIRNIFNRITDRIDSFNISNNPPSTNLTIRPTTPEELKNEANAARILVKKDAQMKIARLLRKL